jgi:hypothetical protein
MQDEQAQTNPKIDWLLGLTWLVVTLSAAMLAIDFVGLMSLLNLSEDWSLLIAPIFVAILQWLVLRETLDVSAWWIPATAVGLTVTAIGMLVGALFVGSGSADKTLLYVLAIGGALLLGAFQSAVLESKLPAAAWWLAPTILSIVGLLALSSGPLADLDFSVAVAGLVMLYGLMTGATLLLLIRRQPAARPMSTRFTAVALTGAVVLLLIYLVLSGD